MLRVVHGMVMQATVHDSGDCSFSASLIYETDEWQIRQLLLFLSWNGEEKVPTESFLYKKDVKIDESNVFEAGTLP